MGGGEDESNIDTGVALADVGGVEHVIERGEEGEGILVLSEDEERQGECDVVEAVGEAALDVLNQGGLAPGAVIDGLEKLDERGLPEEFGGMTVSEAAPTREVACRFFMASIPGLPKEDANILVDHMKKGFLHKETVITEGERDGHLYFLLRPVTARFTRRAMDDGEPAYSYDKEIQPGDHFGERMVLGEKAMSNVFLEGKVPCLYVPASVLDELSDEGKMAIYAKFIWKYARIMSELNQSADEAYRIENFYAQNPKLAREAGALIKKFKFVDDDDVEMGKPLVLEPGQVAFFRGFVGVRIDVGELGEREVVLLKADEPDFDFVGEAVAFGFPATAKLIPKGVDTSVCVVDVTKVKEGEDEAAVKVQLAKCFTLMLMTKVARQAGAVSGQ